MLTDSFGYVLKEGTAGSHGSSIVFSEAPSQCFPQQMERPTFHQQPPHPCQYLLLFVFQMSAIRMRLSLNNWICISLMSKDAELSFLRVFNNQSYFWEGSVRFTWPFINRTLVLLVFTTVRRKAGRLSHSVGRTTTVSFPGWVFFGGGRSWTQDFRLYSIPLVITSP